MFCYSAASGECTEVGVSAIENYDTCFDIFIDIQNLQHIGHSPEEICLAHVDEFAEDKNDAIDDGEEGRATSTIEPILDPSSIGYIWQLCCGYCDSN